MKKILALILFSMVLVSCGARLPYLLSNPTNNPVSPDNEIKGKFAVTDGSTIDLSALTDKPAVIIFSQDTCAACGQEADALTKDLGTLSAEVPSEVRVFTILVGGIIEDAIAFKSRHQLPWSVGVDTDASLFKSYCTSVTVPCNVVFLPKRGIVLRKSGTSELAELEALTGTWYPNEKRD